MACLFPSVDRSRIYCEPTDMMNCDSSSSAGNGNISSGEARVKLAKLLRGNSVTTPYSTSRLDESLHRFVPELSKRLRYQISWDQRFQELVPRLLRENDQVLLGTEKVVISYGSTLLRTGESVAMEVADFQDLRAKFVNNCADLSDIHPSLRE